MLKKTLLLGVNLALIASLHACRQKEDPGHSDANGGKEEITVGAVLPLTGPVASYGQNAKTGIDLALNEINSSSLPFTIRVLYEDDSGKVETALSAAQKLISTDRVPLIIGEAASGLSLALAPIANQQQVVLFTPISSAAELTQKGGDFFFRVCPSDAFQAHDLASWLMERNLKTASVLVINNGWGTSLKDEFQSSYQKLGATIATIQTCNEGDRDFRSHLGKLMQTKPDAIVAFTYGKEGGPFLRQARELGVKTPIFGGDVWGSPELVEAAGEAAEGVFFTFPKSPSGKRFEEFAALYRQRYQKEPDIYSSYSYDLTYILSEALKSGARTGPQFRDYLHRTEGYEGVTGLTKFNSKGDVTTKKFSRQTIQGGKSTQVETR
jgi:branched-chain amino acid transport system substrate-binding protein